MVTEQEQKRLERYFGVEFTNPWPGGYIVHQGNMFILAIPEECTFAQVRNLLSHTIDRNELARNIAAALFWEWRLICKNIRKAHEANAPLGYMEMLVTRRDQAARCFELAYKMAHPVFEEE